MHHLLIATRNAHKTRELARILGADFNVTDVSGRSDLPEVEETGTTFEENAALKAVAISRLVSGLVIADDSGLEVDALGGAPGVYSARYAGVNASDAANVAKLLDELSRRGTEGEPGAQFRCVIAAARGGRVLKTFEGIVRGSIARAAAGANGFGYDPVFKPAGSERTFAEIGEDAKNEISHRARAVEQLQLLLRSRAL